MPVRTNLSGFYSKYTNIQRSTFGVSDTGQTDIGISNGPKTTTYGLQLEATIQPAAGLLLNANYGYLHTKYDDGSPGCHNGNAFEQAPKHTVTLCDHYTRDLGDAGELAASAGYTYQSTVSYQAPPLGTAIALQQT